MDEGLLNDLLECSVCLERLDTSSRVLPCQHTFCLKCLKVIVESHKELRCPECRILVETKVEELPPNVLLMRILEGMRNNVPRKLPTQRTNRHVQGQPQQSGQSRDKQLPPHGRALYDFISKEPGDLSFKKGETILLQKKLDAFWYQGETSGRTGVFPITYLQVIVPLPVPTALCKALYDFRMSAPDEEGCLAFDKGAIITVHRRVDENWAEGRLEQRVGIFPIAFVELNQPARHLINSPPLNRPVPPLPEQARAGHSDHRHHAQHSHRYQPMSMSTPTTNVGNYQNMPAMSHSHPNYHSPPHILPPQHIAHNLTPRNILEPAQTKHSLDLIHFTNVHNKTHGSQATMMQSVSRIGENYDRLRTVKYDSYNTTPVHKPDTTYQNVRTHEHFPVSVANFNANNVSSDSSSSVNTASVVSSTTTPNTSSNESTCESAEPSLPSSPDNNTERNATVIASTTTQNPTEEENENPDSSLNASMGVLSLNESSTATNTSLNVSLPPAESPKLNASANSNSTANHNDSQEGPSNSESSRLDAPSSSKILNRPSGPDSLLNFGIGLQAALSPSHGKDGNYMVARNHRDHHHREKRHSLTPSSHLQANHSTQNRHSAEILATSLLDQAEPEARRRRRSRSGERALPAAYVALYPYKPQKPDELELKKGGMYIVTERCRDGWYKGRSERSQRAGVFPGNYVARSKHEKVQVVAPAAAPAPAAPAAPAQPAPPDAPPRAHSPPPQGQPLSYPWSSSVQNQIQQSTPKSDKNKDKKGEKSISTGVSLMKRLAAMKKCKSPPPVGYSMDNPVFEDAASCSLTARLQPQHVRTPPRARSPRGCSRNMSGEISKSPPPVGYSMDNPVFEDAASCSLTARLQPQHVRTPPRARSPRGCSRNMSGEISKSPPPVGYSMDNPVFEDAASCSLTARLQPQHVRTPPRARSPRGCSRNMSGEISKSPPPVGYSMDNPVFEDAASCSLTARLQPQHVRIPAARRLQHGQPRVRGRRLVLAHRAAAAATCQVRSVNPRRPSATAWTTPCSRTPPRARSPRGCSRNMSGEISKSPPPVGYSMDNPVFEDAASCSLTARLQPQHVRSGSCPSQLLRALPAGVGSGVGERRHKERILHDHRVSRVNTESPWQSQHRKSQSLDVTATRRDRHAQPVKERFRCIVPYPPNSEYELELKVDDIVLVSRKRGDGWYKGTLQRTGRSGLFPASFVQPAPRD
ncbi:E3 ubiquitin-protein ligase SH3RF1 [Cydia pomonella]|uniref:E3 ubiquitin-protein ligase SH3RF1 n=1 Tax=Cydia pomonella TaxID=82600 RepID=UPI002ADDDFB9|nr:E3 ubiquitin-protein ligase SH3RF1 [Cydia pomonella]